MLQCGARNLGRTGGALVVAGSRAARVFGWVRRRISSVAVQKRTATLGDGGALVPPLSGSPASAMLATWPTTLPASSAIGAPLEPGSELGRDVQKQYRAGEHPIGVTMLIEHLVSLAGSPAPPSLA